MPDLSPDMLKRLLRYDPETGEFFWRGRTQDMFSDSRTRSSAHMCNNWNSTYSGKPAGFYSNSSGYRHIIVLGRNVLAHRAAYAIMTGEWPHKYMDHINRVRTDNRWSNLRPANQCENARNTALPADNKTGYKGVHYNTKRKKFAASIRVNRKLIWLGYHATAEGAALAYDGAAERLHGDFAFLNFGDDYAG